MTISTNKAIIQVTLKNKIGVRINYSRRMYVIIKRYTPNVKEGCINECFADLTGLRTFFKMSYKEIAKNILNDLNTEIGMSFIIKISSNDSQMKNNSKNISTYKEMGKLFSGFSFANLNNRKSLVIRKKLTVPFLGKVT